MALAFALIKQMLKLENRSKEACDFGRDLRMLDEQQLVQKTTKPLYPKPHRNQLLEGLRPTEHFSSLAWCFLLSVASRTAPNVALDSAKVEGLSGETTEMSRATGLPRFQFCNRIPAGRDCEWSGKSPAPTSTWTEACAQ